MSLRSAKFDLPHYDELLFWEWSEMSEPRNAHSLTGSPGFPVVKSRALSRRSPELLFTYVDTFDQTSHGISFWRLVTSLQTFDSQVNGGVEPGVFF